MNLHQFIYAAASSTAPARTGPSLKISQADANTLAQLRPTEQATWNRVVSFYATNYIRRDLLFDDSLNDIKQKLESAEASPDLKGTDIPPELESLLLQAAPIYRKYWWNRHNAQNKQWVAHLRPLLLLHGPQLRRAMEAIYETAWPTEPVRIETVAYANWSGAYTTLFPTQPTISTTDAGNQGTAALEVIFHESSHGLVRKLRDAIDDATSKLPADKQKMVSKSLWHAVLFYTAGELVAEDYQGYTPYADQAGLWQRAWPEPIHALIIQDWKPRMDDTVNARMSHHLARRVPVLPLNDAAAKLVKDLASPQ
jgi:hypothetical protein